MCERGLKDFPKVLTVLTFHLVKWVFECILIVIIFIVVIVAKYNVEDRNLYLSARQVKPLELTDFLQVKKSEGYCIVGVEQTANSQSLQDYQFPEKTLLLLGYDRIQFSLSIQST